MPKYPLDPTAKRLRQHLKRTQKSWSMNGAEAARILDEAGISPHHLKSIIYLRRGMSDTTRAAIEKALDGYVEG